MITPPYLTDEEIAFITKPLTQGRARCKYFNRKLGRDCDTRPNGQPLVWRAEWEALRKTINLVEGAANDEPGADAPNFRALQGKVIYVRGQKTKKQSAGA